MTTRTYYSYIHCRTDGTPFYVGKGYGRRAYDFKYSRNIYYKRIVCKHGTANISIGKIECSTEAIAFELEKGLIKCFRRMGVQLCNLTDGGEGASGRKMTAAELERHIAVRKGKKQSVEHIESRKKGLILALATEEARAKLSAATKKTWGDPVIRGRRTAGIAESWADNEDRKIEASKTQKLIGSAIDERAARKDRLDAQWADPAKRALRVYGMQKTANTQKERERKASATKAAWADPDSREKRIAAIKAARNTPESKARTSAASKKAAERRRQGT